MRILKIEEERETMSGAVNRFIEFKQAQHAAPRTIKDYQKHLRSFYELTGESIEEKHVKESCIAFFSAIPDTSPARFNLPYEYLLAFFNWCVGEEIFSNNPLLAAKLHKRRDDGNIKPIAVDDIQRILKVIDCTSYRGLRDYALIMLMLDTGIRPAEALALKITDYNEQNNSIDIRQSIAKTRTQRIVFVCAHTNSVLKRLKGIMPSEWVNGLLFPNCEGKRGNPNMLNQSFRRYCKLSGVERFSPYQLRHTFATLALQNGMNVFTLQRVMGHTSLNMTKRYN